MATVDPGKIRRIRKARGLTQATLAERAGVSVRHVKSIEAGTADPSVSVLSAIAEALEAPLQSLLTEGT